MPTRRISHSVPASEPRCRPAPPLSLQRNAPPLAMVGLRQVDELKVKSKGARQQNRPLRSKLVHHLQRAGGIPRGLFVPSARLGVAPADRTLPQRLHFAKQLFARLLAQHLAQQHAQRTHIAPQRRLFQVAGLRLQLRQPLRPAFRIPQKSHRLLIMHDRNKELIRGRSLICAVYLRALRRKQVGLWSLTMPAGLHESVDDDGADELEAAFLELLRHFDGERRLRGDRAFIPDGLAADDIP